MDKKYISLGERFFYIPYIIAKGEKIYNSDYLNNPDDTNADIVLVKLS